MFVSLIIFFSSRRRHTRFKCDWSSDVCSSDLRSFLSESFGEFSVAKQTYDKARTGWFSCRSACYLASGRPVVAQETGWSAYIPAGRGLLTFHDMEGARAALRAIAASPARHAKDATA